MSVIEQASAANVGTITFTGGEPLLRRSIVLDLIACAHSNGIETGLNSNATLIDLCTAKDLAESGLDHALISLLGPRDIHNDIGGGACDFDLTLSGMRNLKESGISTSVNMVVSKLSLAYLRRTALIAKEIGADTFCAGPMIPSCRQNIPLCLSPSECIQCLRELIAVGKELDMRVDVLEPLPRCIFSADNEAEFMGLFGNRICSAAVSSCAISASGIMRPCIHSDVCYGSVLPDKFVVVWAAMSEWSSPEIFPPECRKCNALMVCEAGCRMSAKVCSGSYGGKDLYMTEPIMDVARASLRRDRPLVITIGPDDRNS